jgi:hypothetical protein
VLTEPVILSTENLAASDPKYDAPQLMFTASKIKHGHFERALNAETAITTFTLEEVQNNQTLFVHGGSRAAPSYYIMVGDGEDSTIPIAATIDFISTPIPWKNILVGVASVVGCVASVGAIGFLSVKSYRYINKKVRRRFPFADQLQNILRLPKVNNFYSEMGREYLNIIYGVSAEKHWTKADIKVGNVAIKPGSLLYKLYQAKAFKLPLTPKKEQELARFVAQAINEVLPGEVRDKTKSPEMILAFIQEQLNVIVRKVCELTQVKRSTNQSSATMLTMMTDGEDSDSSVEEQPIGINVAGISGTMFHFGQSAAAEPTDRTPLIHRPQQ